jgi:hypothetical protein
MKKRIGFSGNEARNSASKCTNRGNKRTIRLQQLNMVDRIQPISFIEDQLNDWGEYVHGYCSNANKLQITEV